MQNDFTLVEFIQQLYKWRKSLLWAIGAIFLVSLLSSLALPNYYKAETIFYAASPDLAKPIPIGDDEKDVRIYGDDKDLDRLFTIATSQELLTHLIDSFDLYTHYVIDSTATKSKYKVKEKLLDNFQTIKTKYGALHLIVEDKDPKIAAGLANAARERIQNIAQDIVKISQDKQIKTYENNIASKQVQADSLSSILNRLKAKVGIFDVRTQQSIYTNLLASAISLQEEAKGKVTFYKKYPAYKDSLIRFMAMEQGAARKIAKAQEELNRYAPQMSELKQLEAEQGRLLDQISLDKERVKQLYATFGAPFSALHIVEQAVIPVQKSRPARMILIALSTFIGAILCMLIVFVIENIKSIKLTDQ
jgi:tyrosine-protein kinase Etk/Wzc